MFLEKIQKDIENLYGLETGINVMDYLYSGIVVNERGPFVLPKMEDDVLSLGVHFTEPLQNLVEKADREGISFNYVRGYSLIIEEVSHFVYLAWKVGQNNYPLESLSVFEQRNIPRNRHHS